MLNLDGWNRKILSLQNALDTDADGNEVFKGLSREESEQYVTLTTQEPSDYFIDLDRKHKRELTGIEDL